MTKAERKAYIAGVDAGVAVVLELLRDGKYTLAEALRVLSDEYRMPEPETEPGPGYSRRLLDLLEDQLNGVSFEG
jgi:hypothetical protein